MLNKSQRDALRYVVNTNGGATLENFIEDHAPIGQVLWNDLVLHHWVREDDNLRIFLTPAGHVVLCADEQGH